MKKIYTQNCWPARERDGKKHNPLAIVLHITDGSFKSTVNHIQNPNSQVSYNWIFNKGDWYECVSEEDAAWANGLAVNPTWPLYDEKVNCNLRTISIGVVNKGEFPNVQHWFKWARGCKQIMKRYNIPLNRSGVVNHFEIRSDKRCPRPWFTRRWLQLLWNIV